LRLFSDDYINDVLKLAEEKRGRHEKTVDLGGGRSMLKLKLPLNEIVVDFHDHLKSITSGYASFDYEECGYEPTSLVKVCDAFTNMWALRETARIRCGFLPKFLFPACVGETVILG